jgi:hypothetical protein
MAVKRQKKGKEISVESYSHKGKKLKAHESDYY